MKNTTENTKSWKMISGAIVCFIAAGTLLVALVANLPTGSSALGTVFICFVGAVIALQLVPGIMLFSAMMKGLMKVLRKEKEQE